jgi:hypothetical protein
MTDRSHIDVKEKFGDVLVVKRHETQRALVGMRGHYKLKDWRDADGNIREFACEILKISPHMIKFSAPVAGAVGDWVVVRFKHLGTFEGPIVQILPRVLVMKIFGTNEDRAKVANKLAWITDAEKPEARRSPRLVPANPDSTMSVPGHPVLPCHLIDYSASGVALYADVNPAMGAVVKIGALLGRVVRHFPGGFAVSFLTLQDPQSVEASILRIPAKDGPE